MRLKFIFEGSRHLLRVQERVRGGHRGGERRPIAGEEAGLLHSVAQQQGGPHGTGLARGNLTS